MAIRVIDDSKLQNIAVAIQGKDGGGKMTVDQMPGRIQAIPSGSAVVLNPALVLWDWESTKLAEFSQQDALALTELPAPDTLPPYAAADHELLVFQSWNWSLANIKTWIQAHEGKPLDVGAIYTTTDGQDHNYWGNPRLDAADTISMQKRGTTSINYFVFRNCYSLTRINIPDGVTIINYSAFSNCHSLTHINIPDSVTYINDYAFSGCHSLTQINIPDGVTYIGSNAFSGCYSLTQINIPDSVTSIGSYVFSSCYSLTQINIPDGVTSIGSYAFSDCRSLTQMNIPDGVTYISNNAFSGCYSLTQINIPNGVTSIGNNAFQGCYSLTSVNIPDSVTSIGSYVFSSCYSLTQINIPDGVTSIGSYAFSDCRSLTQINIPDSVTSIGDSSFNNCKALCDILLESKPPLANINAFSGLPTIYRIYVPRSDLSWFETETNWSTIYAQGHIVAIEDYITYLESIGFDVDKYKEAA